MKKYTLSIWYDDDNEEVEKVEEMLTDVSSIPRILSMGNVDLTKELDAETLEKMNESFSDSGVAES